MTDRTNHRAAAERMLAAADEWTAQAEEPTPEAGELSCLAYAAVHALLALHDTLTAADHYAANEAKQREAGGRSIRDLVARSSLGTPEVEAARAEVDPEAVKRVLARVAEPAESDPLDENDHRDRIDGDGGRIIRKGPRHWHTPIFRAVNCDDDCVRPSLRDWDRRFGPLTFAPEPPPDAARDDLTASEGEGGSVEGEGAAMPYTRRLASCVERWPACASGEYNPACCRFPKNCSPHGRNPDDELEPQPTGTYEPTTTIYCHEGDCEAVITGPSHEVGTLLAAHKATHQAAAGDDADDASEALLCPECGHGIDDHGWDEDYALTRCLACDDPGDCRQAPSDIAQALIERAVAEAIEQGRRPSWLS